MFLDVANICRVEVVFLIILQCEGRNPKPFQVTGIKKSTRLQGGRLRNNMNEGEAAKFLQKLFCPIRMPHRNQKACQRGLSAFICHQAKLTSSRRREGRLRERNREQGACCYSHYTPEPWASPPPLWLFILAGEGLQQLRPTEGHTAFQR